MLQQHAVKKDPTSPLQSGHAMPHPEVLDAPVLARPPKKRHPEGHGYKSRANTTGVRNCFPQKGMSIAFMANFRMFFTISWGVVKEDMTVSGDPRNPKSSMKMLKSPFKLPQANFAAA